MTAASRTDDCVSTGKLAERGWTPAAIRRFLGDPDRTAPNPMYRSAAPMRLFSLARAVAAENTEQWQQWRAKAVERSARGKAVAETKRAALLAEVAALNIRVPVMHPETLAERAVEHRNRVNREWAESRGYDVDPADLDGVDQATLRRWMVNYLRHARTIYDAALSDLYARVGRDAATDAIRERVYAAIAGAYPALADEARRQAAERQAGL
ncbi:hypothetical protein [Actinoplanes sp. NPDC049802]|uniref:hypothetical protein n=1 Tax=Actinoplanes sp. NPDC049802 TaxID=3154742 RepID=UPI0033FDB000